MKKKYQEILMKNIRNKIALLSISALLPIVSIHAVNPAVAGDACYIHTGCTTGVGYSDSGSMGKGWYCTDGEKVTTQTKLDACNIMTACSSDTHSVKYGPIWGGNEHALPRVIGQAWQCFDNAFIHQGCSKGAVYAKDGTTMGSAWYCNDGQKVDKSTQIDASFISPGCKEGVTFDSSIKAWRCRF